MVAEQGWRGGSPSDPGSREPGEETKETGDLKGSPSGAPRPSNEASFLQVTIQAFLGRCARRLPMKIDARKEEEEKEEENWQECIEEVEFIDGEGVQSIGKDSEGTDESEEAGALGVPARATREPLAPAPAPPLSGTGTEGGGHAAGTLGWSLSLQARAPGDDQKEDDQRGSFLVASWASAPEDSLHEPDVEGVGKWGLLVEKAGDTPLHPAPRLSIVIVALGLFELAAFMAKGFARKYMCFGRACRPEESNQDLLSPCPGSAAVTSVSDHAEQCRSQPETGGAAGHLNGSPLGEKALFAAPLQIPFRP